ncbi:hypothetical protein [Actinacidiphila bryophytorum]|uniref:hypothetical protein n=1 Tax=Actinacidiphila bryophytorum TaxID=1436133 RepID=UPI0019620A26|nr:hypothetical protein [Actinacidiphila bryophytorum]MBM9438441.1 hypothetical protein [Actinacidiphila bryophytorum]MBN6545832.1 hypothetical protein [Actinacidiphila bryophytorum]
MQRLLLTLFGATILAIGAGSVPAAAASSQAARASSPAQTTVNEQQCTAVDSSGSRVCLALVSSTFIGQATVHSYPSSCAGYRVSLYDPYTGKAVVSTSLRPCGETPSKQATADASRFTELTAYAEFAMYDSSGAVLELAYTGEITYP